MVIVADKFGRVPVKVGCKHKTVAPKVPSNEVLHAMDADEVRLNESAMQRLAVSAARVAELERQLAHSEAGRKNAEREAQAQHDRANEANARARTLVGATGVVDDGEG